MSGWPYAGPPQTVVRFGGYAYPVPDVITPPRSSGPWHRMHPTPSWFSSLNNSVAR